MLLIDSGNSRIKWMQAVNGTYTQQGVIAQPDWDGLRQAFSLLPQPGKVVVSNVAGPKAEQGIRAACALWSCAINFIVATGEQCGVRNCYEQPAQLGSDRWAALIAAWHKEHAACLVVNCGTATTIDMLSGQGKFMGGLILPGIEMMLHSLTYETAGLKQLAGRYRKLPQNTGDAAYSGAIQATVGAIKQQYSVLDTTGARCLLSGGAADILKDYLDIPFEQMDNMVLRGLQIIGLEAEA